MLNRFPRDKSDTNFRQDTYIYVEDLVLDMSIGIYEHEHKQRQNVVLNISARINLPAERVIDQPSVDGIVSYDDFIETAQAMAKDKHFNLLEFFVESLAVELMNNPLIVNLSIKAVKPDIHEGTTKVGVEMTFAQ